MREAFVTDIFFGIESPDEEVLQGIDKGHNLRMPILDAVKIINSFGIELHAGIILGLDGAGIEEPDKILSLIRAANIPLVAVNVLYALPRTPLWRRLEKAGRLIATADVEESNVVFELPAATVMEQWRRVIQAVYTPEALYRRYKYNIAHTYPNRKKLPLSRYHFTWQMIRIGAFSLWRIFVQLGLRSSYKREFWKMAFELLRSGRLDHLVYIASLSHHLLRFAEDVRSGEVRACFYTEKANEPLVQTRTQRFTAACKGLPPSVSGGASLPPSGGR